jgi:hypothetical protein
VTLPYSPEFDPREGLPRGAAVLAELAELSGGVARTDVVDALRNPPRSARTTSLLPWLFSFLIGLLLLEIVGRRLSLWEQLVEVVGAAVPDAVKSRRWLPEWRLRLPTRTARRAAPPAPSPQLSASPQSQAAPTSTSQSPAPKPPAEKPAIDVFAAAKQRAKRRNQ